MLLVIMSAVMVAILPCSRFDIACRDAAPLDSPPAGIAPVNITGHWEAPITGDGKTFTFSFDFVAKGEVLTGSLELSNRDRTIPITDGRIDGNKVSFKGLGIWTGQLVGAELRLRRELDYGKVQHLVAHRAKD